MSEPTSTSTGRLRGWHHLSAQCLALLLTVGLPVALSQYGGFYGLPGDFCKTKTGDHCCDGRIDSCAVPVSSTLCYCDQFCDRSVNPDCCADYWQVCRGAPPPVTRPTPLKLCIHKGRKLKDQETIEDNCNKCKCNDGYVTCDTDLCLVDEELLEHVQRHAVPGGWNATSYSKFWGKKLSEGLARLTGTLPPDEQSLRLYPIKLHYDAEQLPAAFDARAKWGHLAPIRDQGWCGASWAFSTVSVTQDRLAIASEGTEAVDLSPQNLLDCNRRGQQGCQGGHVENAWNYMRYAGLVTEGCYPYHSGADGKLNNCRLKKGETSLQRFCGHEFPMNRTELYTTEPAYRIASAQGDIMWEIMTKGPVQALMRVYQDFVLYKDGVYSRSNVNLNSQFAVHSVKLIGWGEERPDYTKYWLAANSWGSDWGLGGTFKILRGTNESDIEHFVLTVRPQLSEEARRINRRKARLYGRGRAPRPGARRY